jgi:putative endonuclease
MREYWVYILANFHHTLYIGVTSDLQARVYQHKNHVLPGFTSRYGIHRLVYFESTNDVEAALSREKQLKGWRRSKKVALIETANAQWDDLAASWFEPGGTDPSPAQDDTGWKKWPKQDRS